MKGERLSAERIGTLPLMECQQLERQHEERSVSRLVKVENHQDVLGRVMRSSNFFETDACHIRRNPRTNFSVRFVKQYSGCTETMP
jgi:hypothetical protein